MIPFLRCLLFLGAVAATASGVGCVSMDSLSQKSLPIQSYGLRAGSSDGIRNSGVPDPKELDRKTEQPTAAGAGAASVSPMTSPP